MVVAAMVAVATVAATLQAISGEVISVVMASVAGIEVAQGSLSRTVAFTPVRSAATVA